MRAGETANFSTIRSCQINRHLAKWRASTPAFTFFRRIPLTNPRAVRLSLVAHLAADSLAASRVVPDPGASMHETWGQPAVDDLVASHAEAVYRYALRLTRSTQQAEDLTQETLLRGWKHRRRLREADAARAWLLRIATNLHRDGVRARRVVAPFVAEATSPKGRVGVEGRFEQRECVARALAALDELPMRQRQVLHLVTIEQLSNEGAATVLGISMEALKASLSLGRRAMREKLRDVYEDVCRMRTKLK